LECAAFRNVPFLDDVEDVVAVRKQIEIAIDGAKPEKDANAIGHAHPSTPEALKENTARGQNSQEEIRYLPFRN
jgi:polysaccharide deacetylase 2 family uncharacterized protein YibQ